MSTQTVIAPIGFPALTGIEIRKQVNTRAGAALLWIIAGGSVLLLIPDLIFLDAGELTLTVLISSAAMPQLALLPVLGILAMTSEWSQRTGMTTFTLEPRRGRVVRAKFVSALVMGVGALGLSVLLGMAAFLVAGIFRDMPAWSLDWATLGGTALITLLAVAQGAAFGLLLLNSPAAIVLYFVVPSVWMLVIQTVSWLKGIAGWIDLSAATDPFAWGAIPTGEQWAQLTVAVMVWVGVPLAVGVARVLEREVK